MLETQVIFLAINYNKQMKGRLVDFCCSFNL